MGANAGKIVAAGLEVYNSGAVADRGEDIWGTDVEEVRMHSAEWCSTGQLEGSNHVRHAAGRGFYRTESARNGLVVHRLPMLAILLVVNGQGDGGGGEQNLGSRVMREQGFSCPELDVTDSKLGGTGAGVGSWESVLTNAEQEEESKDDEIGDSLGMGRRVRREARRCGGLDCVDREGHLGFWSGVGLLVGF